MGQKLSADALSMGVGLFFGILASIPAALLVLAASRRGESRESSPPAPRGGHSLHGGQGYQAPVIVLAPPMHGYGAPPPGPAMDQHYLPPSHQIVDSRAGRKFKMVGEEEEWVEEY